MPDLIPRRRRQPRHTGPLVSFGIPVYQKERHLRATLDAALAQTHRNIEVILADNGSTDATVAICREYRKRDRRVRLVERPGNVGSRRNFNLVFELARGDYFVWSRGHDLWAPDFVARGLAVLEREPSVVLWHSRCVEIDVDDSELGTVPESMDTRGLDLAARLTTAWREAVGPATLGIARRSAMDRTRLYQELAGCDVICLLELAVQGAFAFCDDTLLRLRRVRSEQSEVETVQRTWAQMNPFRVESEPPAHHVLQFTERHLQILRELPLPSRHRDLLLSDLIMVYRDKFKGSFTSALDAIADRVHTAASAPPGDEVAALDMASALLLLDRANLGLLFQPEHARAGAARDLLLALTLDLTATPATAAP